MSLLLPSLYVPVATNCCVSPTGTDAVAGVTVILWRVVLPKTGGVANKNINMEKSWMSALTFSAEIRRAGRHARMG
jgi:hypothetical protein